MTIQELIDTCKIGGFDAALVSTDKIVFNPAFRLMCEQNLCSRYATTYACPPDCGSTDEMKQRVLRYSHAIVTKSAQPLKDWRDLEALELAKSRHNQGMLAIVQQARNHQIDCLYCGAGPCDLCEPCQLTKKEACPYPADRYSCLSAYCIDVKKLAETCKLSFKVKEDHVAFFSLIAVNSKFS